MDRFRQLRQEFDSRVGAQALIAIQTSRLEKLGPAGHGSYHPDRGCIPGTRVDVIDKIVTWASDYAANQRLLWIYGFAGLGKSAVAVSVCSRLKEQNLLASSFFCKRDNTLLRDAGCVLNTVIFELAMRHGGYKRAVANAIQQDPQICAAHMQMRYSSLVETPLKSLGPSEGSGQHVIVIDALDETTRDGSRSTLLTCLRNMCQLVPWLKIIVTSRPDDDIKAKFGGDDERMTPFNIADHPANDDIIKFIQQRMTDIAKEKRIEWPDDKVRQLADRANGLFVWAETACKFIAGGFSPDERLEQ
ncbi:hypothetical protein FRC06_010782, partial [Ceratobasidium sp. 370]